MTCATELGLDDPAAGLVFGGDAAAAIIESVGGDNSTTSPAAGGGGETVKRKDEAREAVAGIANALCDMHGAAVSVAAEYERTSGRTTAVRRERAVEALRLFSRLYYNQRAALKSHREMVITATGKLEELTRVERQGARPRHRPRPTARHRE